MRMKSEAPFSDYRQMAKAVNFGFLFGLVAASFAVKTLETSWTEAQADQYIRDNRLRDLKEKIITRYPRESPKMWKMITCATDIRSKFFKTYPGLMERIDRERNFALEHGYIRAWHGACRRTPELFFMEKGEKGRPKGDDNTLYGGMLGTLLNIAPNAAIQNFEAVIVMRAITEIKKWFEDNNMKSFIWGSVHDSIDLALHIDEVEAVCKKIVEVCQRPLPELLGMPMEVDIVVADLKKGEHYKGGKKWKAFVRDLNARKSA